MPTPTAISRLVPILLPLAAAACGAPGADVAVVIEDPPPVYVEDDVELTTSSIDPLDGFVTLEGGVETRAGLEVTSGGSVSFLAFDVSSIPYDARVTWGELVLYGVGYASYGGPVELEIGSVDYGPFLDPGDPFAPVFASERFVLDPRSSGSAIGLDLTGLLRYEIESGVSTVGLRLDAFGGDLLFEDGGSNLGTGAVPLLTVAYEW